MPLTHAHVLLLPCSWGLAWTPCLARAQTIDRVFTLGTGLRAEVGPEWGPQLEADMRIFGRLEAGSVGWSLDGAGRP